MSQFAYAIQLRFAGNTQNAPPQGGAKHRITPQAWLLDQMPA
jgi:hypothetical protein